MKITNIRLIELRVPLDEPIQMSFGPRTERRHLFLEVTTDEGITGLGDTWTNFPFWCVDERKVTLDALKPFFIGLDPLNRNDIWEMIDQRILRSDIGLQYGSKGPVYQALSGIDIALWDIAGKALGLPVYQLLGGKVRDAIPAYASGLSAGDYARRIPKRLEEGFTEFKVKVGFDMDSDIETLGAVRAMIGNHTLYADANQKWRTASEALETIRYLADYGLSFIEEPVGAAQLNEYAILRNTGIARLASGENLYGRQEFHTFLSNGLVDVIQPDVTKSGGITESWAVCEDAKLYGVQTALHMFGTAVGLAASLHVMLASPNALAMEYDALGNTMMTELPGETFYTLEGGVFTVNKRMPGIGIALDPGFVAKYRVHS
jgi:L-alanine-DL-glutamate epimerase-like enolase superfamily enzyme